MTEDDLENLLPGGEKTPFTTEEKALFVTRWVEEELLYREALRRGMDDDPRVRARLRSLEREFLADHLLFIELRERINVTEEEIRTFFEEHRREYVNEYRVSHILLNTEEEAEAAMELLKTKSFAWVANKHSVDPMARRGGDLGYLTKGNMIPEFETVIFEMKPGDVSGIIKSDFGYHIIKLVGMRESRVKVALDDVRERIMNSLIMEKRMAAHREFIDSLKKSAEIEYYKREYSPDRREADEADVKGPGEAPGEGGVQ